MGIVNRRNAVLGWAAWRIGKSVLKRRARAAVPGRVEGGRRPNASALVLAASLLGGVLWLWRRLQSDDEPEQ